MEWISVKDRLPELDEFKQSEIVLCIEKVLEEGGDNDYEPPFAAWYNSLKKEWILRHKSTSDEPIKVTHWMPLPEPPK